MKPYTRSRCLGFSLIEVVLALGLVSVGALSVVAVLGTSLTSSRSSQNDVVLASMVEEVVGELRSVRFEALASADLVDTNLLSLPDTMSDSVFFFEVNGDRVSVPSPAGKEPFYECRVVKTPVSEFKGVSGGVHNLVRLDLHFSWPVSSQSNAAARAGQSRVTATVARYE